MKRKILSLVLVAAMLASMLVFVPAAGAESGYTVEVTKATGYAGDTVTLDIIVTGESVFGYQLLFEYDKSRLELVMNGDLNYTPESTFYNATNMDNGEKCRPWTGGENPLFESIYWMCGGTASDLSTPTKIGTLTFKVKDGAAVGDAYVAFRYVHGETTEKGEVVEQTKDYEPARIITSGSTFVAKEVNYVAGGVTVLPEGYVDGTTNADDFTVASSGKVKYNGSAAHVVVPTTKGANTATTLYANATFTGGSFVANTTVESIVLPASIATIGTKSIYNCANLKDVYILSDTVVIADMGIGYYLGEDEETLEEADLPLADLTIHGLPGSTAETYANENGFTFVADAPAYSLTVDGATYLVAANATAPGAKVNGDQLTVAWKNGDEVIKPGAAMNLTADATLTPVTITSPTINEGVSFKVSAGEAGLAMRFTADLLKADYETLAGLGEVTLGMLIAPEINIKLAGAFTMPALEAVSTTPYVKINIGGFYKDLGDAYQLAGSISNFSNKTLNNNPEFAAVAFASVELANGETITVYGNYNHNANRDVLTVAQAAALDTSTYTTTECGWLANLVTKFAQ